MTLRLRTPSSWSPDDVSGPRSDTGSMAHRPCGSTEVAGPQIARRIVSMASATVASVVRGFMKQARSHTVVRSCAVVSDVLETKVRRMR